MRGETRNVTKHRILGGDGAGCSGGAVSRNRLSDGRAMGRRQLPPRGLPPAAPCSARDGETVRSLRVPPATVVVVEGMGLRRLYLHVDCGVCGALSGGRPSLVPVTTHADRAARDFLRHTLGESSRGYADTCQGRCLVSNGRLCRITRRIA